MIRNFAREQLTRLSVKTLDQVFVMRAKEGLGCSQFEAALTNLIKEDCFPWPSQPEAIWAGQMAMTAVSADEPGQKPLSQCKMVPVVLTLYAGEEDHPYRLAQGTQGIAALRRRQIVRLAHAHSAAPRLIAYRATMLCRLGSIIHRGLPADKHALLSTASPANGVLQPRGDLPAGALSSEGLTKPNRAAIQGREAASAAADVSPQPKGLLTRGQSCCRKHRLGCVVIPLKCTLQFLHCQVASSFD